MKPVNDIRYVDARHDNPSVMKINYSNDNLQF